MPAMPPAVCTVSSQACCSGRMRPVGVLTSIEVNTASWWPTISGVMVMVRQPIRSAEPRARPNWTGRPVRGSGSWPTWFRNRRQSVRVPCARRICCWSVVSAFATRLVDAICPAGTVAAIFSNHEQLLQRARLALLTACLSVLSALQLLQLPCDLTDHARFNGHALSTTCWALRLRFKCCKALRACAH
jgi:hypothetical protein